MSDGMGREMKITLILVIVSMLITDLEFLSTPKFGDALTKWPEHGDDYHLVLGADSDNDIEPDEGEEGPEHCNEENCVRLHSPGLPLRDHKNTARLTFKK